MHNSLLDMKHLMLLLAKVNEVKDAFEVECPLIFPFNRERAPKQVDSYTTGEVKEYSRPNRCKFGQFVTFTGVYK